MGNMPSTENEYSWVYVTQFLNRATNILIKYQEYDYGIEFSNSRKGQFRLMEIRIGLVVFRPLSIESLKMAEGIAGIYTLKPALIGSIFVMT